MVGSQLISDLADSPYGIRAYHISASVRPYIFLRMSIGIGRLCGEPGFLNPKKLVHRAIQGLDPSECVLRRLAAVRPSLDDVVRCTRAEPRSRRGVGSRMVPHRINVEEHSLYLVAQKRGFVVVRSSGGRRTRKGSPLLNCLRQRADALAQPLIWVEQHRDSLNYACIDYAPVRPLCHHELTALHERTLAATAQLVSDDNAECSFDLLNSPCAPGGESEQAVLPTQQQMLSLPIWALHPITARFQFRWREESNDKTSKRLAAALAAEFDTVRQPPEKWHEVEDNPPRPMRRAVRPIPRASGGKRDARRVSREWGEEHEDEY